MPDTRGGRAAVVVPNGVFAPYTSIPTNLLFFDRSGPTKCIWYYEMPLPEGRKNYSKTKPIQYEEFAECLAWWSKRKPSGRAWKVKAPEVVKRDDDGNLLSVNLDIKNPNAAEALEHLPPEQLVEDILAKERRIMEIIGEMCLRRARQCEQLPADGEESKWRSQIVTSSRVTPRRPSRTPVHGRFRRRRC